jgi:hypothetical protein
MRHSLHVEPFLPDGKFPTTNRTVEAKPISFDLEVHSSELVDGLSTTLSS